MVLDRLAGRPAAALVVDGRVEDLLIAPPPGVPVPETILRGVADRMLKGLGGATVRLPGGATGFLRKAQGIEAGQAVAVQVTGFAEPGKAVPLTARLLCKGAYAIATPGAPGINVSRRIRDGAVRAQLMALGVAAAPGQAVGLILRSAAQDAGAAEIGADIAAVLARAAAAMAPPGTAPEVLCDGPDPHAVALREWAPHPGTGVATGGFDALGVHEAMDGFRQARVPLPGGAGAFIEPTRALVAVDVNTGADTSPAAGLKANQALVRELPRQLRCRGLGGQIVIDPAPMPKARRQMLETELRRALAADPVDTTLVGWTPLGHIELIRKRERLPLAEALGG